MTLLKYFPTFVFVLSTILVFGQEDSLKAKNEEKEIHELDKKGGFQDIKLNTEVSLYEGLEYKKDIDEEHFPNAQLFVSKKGYYTNIGRVEIHSLEVKVYKNKVYEIIVELDKDPAIYQGLTSNFGEARYNLREKAYYWRTDNVRLYFKSGKKNRLFLEYYSYTIYNLRKEEIRKSYTDVTDDF